MEVIIETAVLTKLRRLPPAQQQEVLNFVEFLAEKAGNGPTATTAPKLHQHPRQVEMLAQVALFESRIEELRQKYLGEYVAFHQGAVVDHDLEHRPLVKRINAHYPEAVVLIRQVTEVAAPPLRLGSPRLVRSL